MVLPQLFAEEIYGPAVVPLLRAFHLQASEITRTFAARFYDSLMQAQETQSLLALLTPDEFRHLQARQTSHLLMLLDPELEEPAHRAHAKAVGRVHGLVGVDMMWLIDAYNLYQQALHGALLALPLADQRSLQRLLDRRLMVDLQAQSVGYQQIDTELALVLAEIQQAALLARSTTDLYQDVLKAICSVDGVLAANVGRLGPQGVLEVEALDGSMAQTHINAFRAGAAPAIRILHDAAGDDADPATRAWKTGQVVSADAYMLDPSVEPWRQLGASLGFRSSVAIPLVDEAGQTFALLSIYSRWPGFFRAHGRLLFLQHIQQTFSLAALRHVQGNVIPHDRRRHFSRLIEADRMVLLYQPIIDLRSGKLKKVEALGRLVDADGSLIPPAAFLPTLGNRDLLRLFEFGIAQICRDLRSWHSQGQKLSVSLNFPPQGIGDPEYHEALFRTLEQTGTDTELIELEILESPEFKDQNNRDTFLHNLKLLGIRLIQDDLGAGHSSLLRMDSMPFDEVKIDQGLVRRAARKHPHRAFGFIYYLTQLAHELGALVTVEGLENPGLIEAALIMGADSGQGYGIARPMPAEDIAAWACSFRPEVDPLNPRTAWGALAGYLLWDRELKALDPWPQLIEEFVRAPCRVQRFIERKAPATSSLQQLLDRNHSVAMHGSAGRMYRLTRRAVINALAEEGKLAAGDHDD
ncbi:EAL domain-containing protein [Thiomonas delicata]|uniref:EAL domain-containing protein n=1 Tax=Thiomonas delicata TaxID=364030 RepID=A0A238D9A4_THIDL|nr:EAL domain-containing protein [Thiomonas delicata]SBP89732.1 conserved hypothetical protein [Thiomonas delicata]